MSAYPIAVAAAPAGGRAPRHSSGRARPTGVATSARRLASIPKRKRQHHEDRNNRVRVRSQDLRPLLATGRERSRRRRHRARLQVAQRLLHVGGGAVRVARPRRVRARSARARQVGRRALLRRQVLRLRERRRHPGRPREVARAGPPGVHAGTQRRRGHLLRLRARLPVRARRPRLRELRLPGAGARLRARRPEGPEPPRSARSRPPPQDRGLLARPRRSSRR